MVGIEFVFCVKARMNCTRKGDRQAYSIVMVHRPIHLG